ncbi:LysM peptidoglycan-binding domain-containing protein [Lysobacter enzymogenes]|uniref:LysM peptidoglycan-binding domain-containing protein n=1 Tax=Lysobacter enzymogenes TaxID=69 RepID=UPI001A9766D9|nr:LysM peptidoglycan-binding domain-containing protein [Lysobacter enzymogenes]QQP95119.1 LysM peptidoglycan-binding domain-containing protein [Lysobacter enzymogenes]
MVAIVTGNGLGLQASSALGLGGRGQIGGAGVGKTGEQAFVNAATGNLILRDRDQWLMGRGVDAELYRAYNSQAQLVGETWRAGVSKQVGGLTGTVNAAGSSVYRTDWDGSRIAYAWDAARSLYVASEGAGTRDTLAWDGGNQRWTWTQGGSQLIERYDAANSGRLIESVDRDGNAVSYVYNGAGALSQVVTANGETTYLDYDSNGRLSQLRTVTQTANGTQTSTAVRYGYDSAGRLGTVTLDLSPDDNSVADGKVFTTTYGYDGSSGRIASITQSDGAKVAFGYQLIDGQYRVVSIAQTSDAGVLRTTTLSYDTANRRTTIVDPLGQDTILSYDAQGRLLQTSSPMVNGAHQTQTFTYDAAGQVATIRDGLGNEVKYTYDAAGNLIKQEDAVGTVVERTFGSDNQLLSETVSGPNTATATTRYVYDAEQHLRFKVSAEGRVSELRYNAAGQLIATLGYSEGNYAGSTFTEAALTAWAGATARIGERTDSEYDFRGNLSQVTRYATLAADGSGVLDDQVIRTRFVYDAQGRLLQRYVGPIAAPEVEQFVYDGLGRTIRVTGFNDAVTVTQYDDAQRRTVTTLANGLVRTSTYNHAGELIALAESNSGGTVLSQVRYHYDADGRLRMSEDALGAKTHVLYDEAGRRVGEIDAAGALTEYVYDANNQVVRSVRYANTVNATALAALLDANGKPKQTATVNGQTVALTLANAGVRPAADTANDRLEWRFYDAAGRLAKSVNGGGVVTDYVYDAASRVVASVVRTATVDPAALRADPNLANATVQADAQDRKTRYFYSADGQLRGTLSADLRLQEHVYDATGRRIQTIAYERTAAAEYADAGSFEQLRSYSDRADARTRYRYDARGLLTAQIDGENNVTRYAYDAYGNIAERIRGERLAPPQGGTYRLHGSFQAQTYASAPGQRATVKVWVDGALAATIEVGDDAYRAYAFSIELARASQHEVRLEATLPDGSALAIGSAEFAGIAFDAGGDSRWTGAAGSQTFPRGDVYLDQSQWTQWLAAAPDVDPQWQPPTDALATTLPGVRERTTYEYDADGHLLRQTEYSGSGDAVSGYDYDTMGQLVGESRGDRQARYRYDLQGRLLAQLSGEGVKALQALGANPGAAQVEAIWNAWGVRYAYDAAGRRISATDALGRSTLSYYDAAGRVTHLVNAMGEVSERRYNAWGDLTETVVYAKRLTAASLGQMRGGALGSAERTAFALLDDAQASRTRLSYTTAGAVREAIDAMGGLTRNTYGAWGQLSGTRSWTSYLDRSDATALDTGYDYDAMGRVSVVRSYQSPQSWFGRFTSYDRYGLIATEHGLGVAEYTQRRDRAGRVAATGDVVGNWTHFVSDAFGNVLARTDRTGARTEYSYTAFNREVRTRSAEGVETVARYNEHGQAVELTDGRGNKTVYVYDLDGRLKSVTTPDGVVRSSYDKAGQLIETVDARGVKTVFEYDAVGRMLTRTLDPDGLAIKTRYDYDAKGQLIRTTDPNGTAIEVKYDLNGRQASVVVDAGAGRLNLTTGYEYDAAGRTVRVTEGMGTAAARVTQNSYDKLGRLETSTVDPDGLAIRTEFAYDEDGRLVARRDALEHLTRYVYDSLGRLRYSIDAAGAVEARNYDQEGRLIRVRAYATAIDTTWMAWMLSFEKAENALPAQTADDRVTRYAYDRDGRVRYVIDPSNAVRESVYDNGGNIVRSIAYATPVGGLGDAPNAADVAAALAAQSAGAHAADRTGRAMYDAAGRAVFQVDAAGYVVRNRYDAAGNLLASAKYAATYPANGAIDRASLDAWADAQPREQTAEDRWVYDAAGRVTWQVDAGDRVTRNTYDAAGRLRTAVRFMRTAAYPAAAPAAYTEAGMAAWFAQYVQSDSREIHPTTMWFYDAAGRVRFVYDAIKRVSETRYDAVGNVVHTRVADAQYQRPIVPTDTVDSIGAIVALGWSVGTRLGYDGAGRMLESTDDNGAVRRYQRDGLGQVVAEFAAWGSPAQTETRRKYDPAGRLVEETRAAGTTVANTSRRVYDAFGQLIAAIDPRGVELAESDSPWALAERKRRGATDTGGAALLVSTLSAEQKAALLAAYTTRTRYDVNGRATQTIDALGGVVARSYDAFGDAVKVVDALGNAGYFYFDALGRVSHQVDPMGYLTRTEYDALGNTAAVYRYLQPVAGAVDGAAPPAPPAGAVAVTRMRYDLAGQLIGTTDAENGVESFEYDAAGRRTKYRNKLGGEVAYAYDRAGQLIEETYLSVSVALADGGRGPLTNRYVYDMFGRQTTAYEAFGSREIRGRTTAYDALGRPVYALSEVALEGESTTDLEEGFNHDARGNLIEKTDGRGGITRYYYDANDRLIGQVDPNGRLTLNEYDAVGNLLRTRSFVQAVALPAGDALPAIPLDGAGRPAAARETQYRYDAAGRRIEATTVGVLFAVADAPLPGGSYYTLQEGSFSESWVYDLGGRLVSRKDGNSGVARSYYDALGRKTLELDAEGYRTDWTYDAEGNVLEEQRYAKLHPNPLPTSGDLTAYFAAWPEDDQNDRVTVYSYDKMGRRLSETRKNVDARSVGSNGQLAEIRDADATTGYAYDAAGNLLRRTDALGNVFGWEYDKLGRNIAKTLPGFVDHAGRSITARTEYDYNGLHQIIREVRVGTAGEPSQTDTYVYAQGGRLMSQTNAMGYTTSYSYNAGGDMLGMSYQRTDSAGVKRSETVQASYDVSGRETARVTVASDGSRSVERRTAYNLFGEVTGRGIGPGAVLQEFAEYDLAGRMIRGNLEGGVVRVFYYDANGNAALRMESQTVDLRAQSYAQLPGVAGVFATITQYDKRNQVVDVIQPTMTADPDRWSFDPKPASPTRIGQIGVNVGGPVGYPPATPLYNSANGSLYIGNGAGMGPMNNAAGLYSSIHNGTIDTLSVGIDLPDYTAQFGPAYQIRIEVGSYENYWRGPDPQFGEATGNSSGSFVGTQADRYATINLRSMFPDGRFGMWDDVWGNVQLSISVYIVSRSMGGGREFLIADGFGEMQARGNGVSMGFYSNSPGSTFVPLTPSLPAQFSVGTVRLPNDGFRQDITPQFYYRPWGSSGAFQLLPISRTPEGGMATVDVSQLPAQQYEVLYVSERNDGALGRRERYSMRTGPNASIALVGDAQQSAYLVNGIGMFVWAGNELHAVSLRMRRGELPRYAAMEYRRKGTQDAWTYQPIPHLAPPNSFNWWDAGTRPGDYEVRLIMTNDAGQGEILVGEIRAGASPSVFLQYQYDPSAVTLSNLPRGAESVSFTITRPNGSVAVADSAVSIVNGVAVWAIPDWLLAESGSNFTVYGIEAKFSSGSRTVPSVVYKANGTIQIGPQRTPAATIAVPGNLYTLSLEPPASAPGDYIALHYRPEGDPSRNFEQVIVRRAVDGKFHWDTVDLDKSKMYEYYYDVYGSLADAQNPNGLSRGRSNGYFWPVADGAAAEVRWVYRDNASTSTSIHRRQSWNAFGEVASETVSVSDGGDPRLRDLEYNTLGKLVKVRDPETSVTYANGFSKRERIEQIYYYDLAGSLVGYVDGNGNLTTQAWNYGSAKPSVSQEWHADGGSKTYRYDVFGNQRIMIDEIGRQTDYRYDNGNRLVQLDRPVRADGQRATETYAYDEQDRRLRRTTVLGSDTTDYSIEGDVSRTVSAEGRVTTYTAVWNAQADGGNGAWERTTAQANGRSMTDVVNAYGQKLQHRDLGGNMFYYRYNRAGLLASSTTDKRTAGQEIVYEYYNNGLIKTLNDQREGIVSRYEYDRNGNRTFEGQTGKNGAWVFQQSVATYDELNRLTHIQDPRYVIDYRFDGNGNRVYMKAVYVDPLTLQLDQSRPQEYWYQYDAMNRFTVTMGKLRGTAANKDDASAWVWQGDSGDGVLVAYDRAGQRIEATYASDRHVEQYAYDSMGYLTDTKIGGVVRASRSNDLAGRVLDYREYDADRVLRNHITHTWDRDSLLVQDFDNLKNTGTRTYRFGDGTVEYTQTYDNNANPGATVKTTYTYQWFDSAKQQEIRVDGSAPGVKGPWAPGFSHYSYDDLGRILVARDETGGRSFSYQVDGEGRILQRDELMGGEFIDGRIYNATQNRYHSYFLFDDRQVGNLGNDGIDRIDYVKELAQNQAPAGARNDDRHKRFTPVGGVDFDQNYQPINSLYPTAAPGSYIVKAGDTLQSIANAVWGDGAMWYLLADANGLAPNQPLIANTVLTVPNKVTNIHNNAGTFKPYDAGAAMGNTSPTLPEPPPPPTPKKGGCGGFVQILAIVVAVVVTIYTAGAAAGLVGLETTAATTFGAGLQVLGGVATAATTGLAATAGVAVAGFAAGAIGGAVGSIASQGVLIAGGAQNGFDWKGVATSALGSGISAGLAGSAGLGSVLDKVGKAAGGFGRAVAAGAVNSAVTTGLASVMDLGSFSWKNVAISAVSSGVGYAAGQGVGRLQYDGAAGWGDALSSGRAQQELGKKFTRDVLSGFAAGAVSAAARGNLSGEVLMQVGLDVVASTIGNSIVEQAAARQQAFADSMGRSEQRMQDIARDIGDRNMAAAADDAAFRIQAGADRILQDGVGQRLARGDIGIDRDFDRNWAMAQAKAQALAGVDSRGVGNTPGAPVYPQQWWGTPSITGYFAGDLARTHGITTAELLSGGAVVRQMVDKEMENIAITGKRSVGVSATPPEYLVGRQLYDDYERQANDPWGIRLARNLPGDATNLVLNELIGMGAAAAYSRVASLLLRSEKAITQADLQAAFASTRPYEIPGAQVPASGTAFVRISNLSDDLVLDVGAGRAIGEPVYRTSYAYSMVRELDAYGNEIMYRAMSLAEFRLLKLTGKVPPGSGGKETMLSPLQDYSTKYRGVLVRVAVKPGTMAELADMGAVANTASMVQFPGRPFVGNVENWTQNYALIKMEKGQINTGLGQGRALQVFNDNVVDVRPVSVTYGDGSVHKYNPAVNYKDSDFGKK